LAADAAALITLSIHIALCCPAGMLPIDRAAPSLAAVDHVTPDGAVDSLAIVCSVPFTADVPNAIRIAVSAEGVLVLIQTLALCKVKEP
jgi:hypothetical protein